MVPIALAVGGSSNIILAWLWWHNRSQTGFAPLDDYQVLKENLDLVAPVNSTPNSSAIVSSICNDIYLLPVLTLGYSISKHYADNASTPSDSCPSPRRLLFYIPGRISPPALCLAHAVGLTPHPVTYIEPPHNGEGVYHRFADQYTKLALWALDQIGIERAVYLDGDTIVRRRFDELFD
ncbi:hypothetical protein DENSPDRAFT_929862 [Dentipellis sp. KUC8613]|nr:hypothetical protein DENSPDRAFT_929862 [Dentipellis sp. KUC8613]